MNSPERYVVVNSYPIQNAKNEAIYQRKSPLLLQSALDLLNKLKRLRYSLCNL